MRVKKRIIIGVTGSIGCGKSTVAGYLKSYGAEIIDADRIARQVLRPDTGGYKKIIRIFGKGVLKKNRLIDRQKLGGIVFNNKIYLRKLNTALHPEIIRIIKTKINNSHSRVIIIDAPLLIESGLNKMTDKLIVVTIKQGPQIKRLLRKTALSKSDILKRIGQQMPLEDKVRLADFIIDNSGTMEKTRKQTRKIWESLVA